MRGKHTTAAMIKNPTILIHRFTALHQRALSYRASSVGPNFLLKAISRSPGKPRSRVLLSCSCISFWGLRGRGRTAPIIQAIKKSAKAQHPQNHTLWQDDLPKGKINPTINITICTFLLPNHPPLSLLQFTLGGSHILALVARLSSRKCGLHMLLMLHVRNFLPKGSLIKFPSLPRCGAGEISSELRSPRWSCWPSRGRRRGEYIERGK